MANYENKLKYLTDALKKGNILNKNAYNWSFFEIDMFESDNLKILHGYLVKYKTEKDEEVVDSETHSLTMATIRDSVIAKSRFFIEVHSGIIIFHPVSVSIELTPFMENFIELFHNAYERMFVNIDIQIIQERYQIFEEIKKFTYIDKLSIILHPSNPSNSRVWEKVDERLKEVNANKYVEVYEAKKDNTGLKIQDEEEIKSKITMAIDGYGVARIEGLKEGRKSVISSKENPVITEAPGDDQEKESVFDFLKVKLYDIFDRFKK